MLKVLLQSSLLVRTATSIIYPEEGSKNVGKHLSTIGITLLCILIKIENNKLHIQQYEIGNFMYLCLYIETIQLSNAILHSH